MELNYVNNEKIELSDSFSKLFQWLDNEEYRQKTTLEYTKIGEKIPARTKVCKKRIKPEQTSKPFILRELDAASAYIKSPKLQHSWTEGNANEQETINAEMHIKKQSTIINVRSPIPRNPRSQVPQNTQCIPSMSPNANEIHQRYRPLPVRNLIGCSNNTGNIRQTRNLTKGPQYGARRNHTLQARLSKLEECLYSKNAVSFPSLKSPSNAQEIESFNKILESLSEVEWNTLLQLIMQPCDTIEESPHQTSQKVAVCQTANQRASHRLEHEKAPGKDQLGAFLDATTNALPAVCRRKTRRIHHDRMLTNELTRPADKTTLTK